MEKYVFPDIRSRPINELIARMFVTMLEPIKARGNLETLKQVLQRINKIFQRSEQ